MVFSHNQFLSAIGWKRGYSLTHVNHFSMHSWISLGLSTLLDTVFCLFILAKPSHAVAAVCNLNDAQTFCSSLFLQGGLCSALAHVRLLPYLSTVSEVTVMSKKVLGCIVLLKEDDIANLFSFWIGLSF